MGRTIRGKSTKEGRKHTQTVAELSKGNFKPIYEANYQKQRGEIIILPSLVKL
ncbi:hypothetical protein IMSAGC005_01089 [Lachnospiraceae bacterium]|nr:hypothetical protein IMSAGC005_01089 [Lachnospiraceae bacterium]